MSKEKSGFEQNITGIRSILYVFAGTGFPGDFVQIPQGFFFQASCSIANAQATNHQLAESLLVACWLARSLDGVLAGSLAGLLACLLPRLPAFLLAARMADLLACLLPGCPASWLPGCLADLLACSLDGLLLPSLLPSLLSLLFWLSLLSLLFWLSLLSLLSLGWFFLSFFYVFVFQSGALVLAICYILEQKPLHFFMVFVCFSRFFHGVHWFTQSVHHFFHKFHWVVHGFNRFVHGFDRFFHA